MELFFSLKVVLDPQQVKTKTFVQKEETETNLLDWGSFLSMKRLLLLLEKFPNRLSDALSHDGQLGQEIHYLLYVVLTEGDDHEQHLKSRLLSFTPRNPSLSKK